ncbi:MAG TPA: Gfo/Idh/MocA family oxidoreductase [Clostridiales bacterium]|nr:Gfo/Idh/MocA family oxidoreductase [Clostridiales bacterium]
MYTPVTFASVTFAIVGSGTAAKIHATALMHTDYAELVAVFDSDTARAQAFADNFQKENPATKPLRVVSSWQALLEDERIEVLCLCTPSGLHATQAAEALLHGKHVLVEKPLALNPADCDHVIAAAEKSGKICSVVSQLRFSPAIEAVKQAVHMGCFGRLVCGEVSMPYHRDRSYYENSPWRGTWAMDGGGALMNQGIHGVDILLHWMGRAESVGAFCRTLAHPIETEDTAVAVVSFAGGAVGTILAATSPLPGYRRRLALYGTEGSVLLEEDCIVCWDLDAPAPDLPSGNQGGHRNPAAISAAGHQRHMEDMVLAVRTGTPVMLDAKEGKRAVELIYSVYQSAQTGQIIKI